ncbi:surface protein [Lactococcus cremoris]|uniref:M57 family metalloprotease n=1 Tax=Lactococcus lactis subsp. cremoris TaxID=1359 RepID=UPI000C7D2046|nr:MULTISPECIES: BspA family leucine-rich repeat surface protein [Lactococcus]ARE18186.2 BspA family leucine-rich repeat surface protein [Lactococcus cremoris]MCT0457415.1 BspA family leucine-rich repeat surface protein [Lactococcus cremoris]MCT4415362.1 BspA family leucine-rich repeat surface protein [Lactococcus cremoris]MCT4416985.1 BspA family leucine-rich repeat surface protein [Lactococcus cremoris]TEA98974.1 surface protein [Lactococcus cremoris]
MKKNLSKTQMLLLGATLASLSIGIVSYGPTIINPQAVSISADVRASTGKWGEANWVLANDGELIFLGGNIGHPSQSLTEVLREANVDPADVKSIEFTEITTANEIANTFANLPQLKKVLKLGNLSYSGSAYGMFSGDSNLEIIDLEGFDTSEITNMANMFAGIKADILDVSKFDTRNVRNMAGMFDGAINLTNLDISKFSTDKVTDMTLMFANLTKLEQLNVSKFNTNNVASMAGMFEGVSNLTNLDISNFNTDKVTDMALMFAGMTKLEQLDVSNFNTNNTASMAGMFEGVSNLTNLDISNFNTDKVTDMALMFAGMTKLEQLDVSNFNTNNTVRMPGMFEGVSNLTNLDISNFNTDKVTDMARMFAGMTKLEQLNLSNFSTNGVSITTGMFEGASNLKNLKLGLTSQLNTDMNLANVPVTDGYTGKWRNVGSGTVDNPAGEHIWTSSEFMANFDAPTMADTYVWQKLSGSEMELGESTDYSNDTLLSSIFPAASIPLNPYRYKVVLNNNYQFYSKLENGQLDTENITSLGDLKGKTLYNKETLPVTYTSGDKKGQTTNFVNVSLEGDNWYWVDEHALNLDLAATYPSVNGLGQKLVDGMFLGSTLTYGNNPAVSNSQMISNAYNSQGKIIYESRAKIEDFAAEADPEAALAAFNKEIDRAAESWNAAINPNEPTIIKSGETTEPTTLLIAPNPKGTGSATSIGKTGIEIKDIKLALDTTNPNYDLNPLFLVIRHELGHSLGLNHTSNAQYSGMPDGYRMNTDEDVMNAILVYDKDSGYSWSQKTITQESIDTIHLILKNQNFSNPQH